MVIAKDFQDPLLDEVRQTVRAMTDDVPFLLLPLRLETRFMTREQPTTTQQFGIFGSIVEKTVALTVRLFDPQPDPLWFHASQSSAQGILADLANLGDLTRQHRDMLVNLTAELRDAAEKLPASDPPNLAEGIRETCQNIAKTITDAPTVPDATADNARTYLDDFRKLANRLDQLAAGRIPYTNPKNKRDLYSFVEALLADIRRQYQFNVWQAERIRKIEKAQLNRIIDLHAHIRQRCDEISDWLEPLHKDAPWKTFVQSIPDTVQQQFVPLFAAFEEVVVPRLRFVQEIAQADVTSMTFSAARLWLNTEKANRSELEHFNQIRTARKKALPNVLRLQEMSAKALVANTESVGNFQSLWQQTTAALNTFGQKAGTFNTASVSQQFGLAATQQFVSEKSQAAPGGYIGTDAAEIVATGALDFHYSFTFSNAALAAIQNLLAKIALGATEQAVDTDLEKIRDDFRVAARHQVVLSQTALTDLQAAVKNLKTALGDNPRFRVSMTLIETALGDFNAIVTNPKSDLYEQYRFRPVWSNPGLITDELWVRVYPDNLFVQAHESELTAQELAEGKKYWKNRWIASGDPDLELGAWRALTALLGAHRAAWVARALDPNEDAANAAVLAAPPSQALVEITKTLAEIGEKTSAFKPANGSNPAFVNGVLALHMEAKLNIAATRLADTVEEQIFLLEKAGTHLQRIGVRIGEIVKRLEGFTPAQQQQFSAVFQKMAERIAAFQTLYDTLRNIQALDADTFGRRFPEEPFVSPENTLREGNITKTPTSPVLPDRFVVVTKNGGEFRHIVVGNPVPADLPMGVKPALNGEVPDWTRTPNGDLLPEEGIRWMTDFEEAQRKGMGLVVPLTREQKLRGFDQLFVLGIRDSSFDQAAGELKQLFDSHHYSPLGLAFLPPDTPTNHTEGEASGWVRLDSDPVLSQKVEMSAPLFPQATPPTAFALTDGRRLTAALGLPVTTFQHILKADGRTISSAFAMHQALWHGTLGHYLTEMWNTVMTVDNVARTRTFFTENVAARGILPSLRIGRQPYGFLTTTAFSRMKFAPGADIGHLPPLTTGQARTDGADVEATLRLRFDIRLQRFLQLANAAFTQIQETHAKHAGNVGANDPQKHFMEMLGLNASSVEFHVRFAVNMAKRNKVLSDPTVLDMAPGAAFSADSLKKTFGALLTSGVFAGSFEFVDEIDPSVNAFTNASWRTMRLHNQVDRAQIFRQRMMEKHFEVYSPLVALTPKPEDLMPLLAGENHDYLQWLLDAVESGRNLYSLINGTGETDKPIFPANNLLFLLLKQSLLEAATEASLDILQADGFFDGIYRRQLANPEFALQRNVLNSKFYNVSRHSWLVKDLEDMNGSGGRILTGFPLFQHLSAGARSKNMGDYVFNEANIFSEYAGHAAHETPKRRMGEILDAIRHLRQQPVRELTQLLAEHLDVCNHRLDAWVLGLANRRLAEVRAAQSTGIYLGAYGWLEDLRPTPTRTEAPDVPPELAGKNGQPVFQDKENQGFIHAPSTGQAIAAAILRAGYRANAASEENLTNRFSVNLSSARVRSALYLIDGVRNGNELGALLGYQFERGLHERYQEAEMDKFILPFRLKYPLVVPIEDVANGATTSVANVVNGLTLLEEVNAVIKDLEFPPGAILYDLLTQNNFEHTPPAIRDLILNDGGNNMALRVLLKEIDRMADAMDAVGDVALSESVYQLVQGNHVRAAAVVSALAEGRAIPDPQIVQTPRTGTVVTQRVVLPLLPRKTSEVPLNWPDSPTPRALAEPSLNYWLGDLMGNPTNIRCMVAYQIGEDGFETIVSLADLAIQPLDVLFLLNFQGENAVSELENRVVRFLQGQNPEKTIRSIILQAQQRDELWDTGILTFFEFETLVKTLRDLFANAMPLQATDLAHPTATYDRQNPGSQLENEFSTRILPLADELVALQAAIAIWVDNRATWNEILPESADLTEAASLAVQAANLGVANAFPGPEMLGSPKTMLLHLKGLLAAVTRTNDLVEPLRAKAGQANLNVKDQVLALVDITKTIFGKTFPVAPRFQVSNFADLDQQLQLSVDQDLLRHLRTTGGDMQEWLQGVAPVRPAVLALETVGLMADAFGQPLPELVPLQLPFRNGDYWLGAEFPDGFTPGGDKLSLVVLNKEVLGNDENCGFSLDEWVEIIPNQIETTAVSFHYDQPNAEPPQTVLLAVTPERTGQWEWDHLLYTLEETLALAKNRAVEPDHLEKSMFQHVLPALITESVPDTLRGAFLGKYATAIQADFTKMLVRD